LSEAGYDKIIEWARSILPEGNRLKENFYAAKSMMKPLGLGYQKIDMCPNFCMLYYLENAEMTECMTCGHSRYKPRTGRGKTLVAYKKLRYFPITPRLQRLFMSPRTAEHMTCYQAHHAVDGVMVHPSDGKAWKCFNSVHPHFSAESRNVRLGLCTDTIKALMSYPKCRSVTVINNPTRPGSNHREVNYINNNNNNNNNHNNKKNNNNNNYDDDDLKRTLRYKIIKED